ncbi:MAG: hypothetical protein HY072_10200 [Deltaproteobacteria bacterium]|nr:hypothetical protein [Deltaproteobacteria bacterium]MBI4925772.1 hypothetical protein [Bdellovibrio sp.]
MRLNICILLVTSCVAFAGEKIPILVTTNHFKTPQELIEYYCARDGAGFYWTGMTEAERKNLTTWKEIPSHDSFLITKQYKIVPQKTAFLDEAQIEVIYDLTDIGDAHGTRSPAAEKEYRVTFYLKKHYGRWKIQKPNASQIVPVLLESHLKNR